MLGFFYKNGLNVIEKDYKTAIIWFEKAGKNDYSKALYILGQMYLDGEGVERNFNLCEKYLVKAARLNNEDANYLLGIFYHDGILVVKNYKIAFKHFTEAARKNHPDSMYMLGKLHFEGNDVQKNINKALELYKEASKYGSAKAQYVLSKLFLEGTDVEKDLKKGLSLIEEAAKNNHSDAQYELSTLYFYGKKNLLPKDTIKAMDWLTKSANNNNNAAQLKLGNKILGNCNKETNEGIFNTIMTFLRIYEQKPLCKTGLKWISTAVLDNYVPALIKLANIYLEGKFVDKDKNKAILYLETATGENVVDSIKAYHLLGKVLLEGDNLSTFDSKKAIIKLERAAEKGNLDSSYILGTLYLEGKHVEEDPLIGKKYFEKAAEKGHGNSQYALANLYYEAKYLKQNCNRAIDLFKKSIELKDEDSHASTFTKTEELIGDIYRNGCVDVEKDIGLAIEWYGQGDRKHNPSAQYKLFEVKDELEKISEETQHHEQQDSPEL